MSKFKDKLDLELSYIKATDNAQSIINKAEHKTNLFTFSKAVAAVLAVAIVLSAVLIPSKDNGFVIIANAHSTFDQMTPDSNKATGDELNTNNFIELKSEEPNYIFYNFNYILDENADDTDLIRKYLFHSFSKLIDINVKGDDIEKINYKINNGSLTSFTYKTIDAVNTEYYLDNSTSKYKTDLTINYGKQENTSFMLNPVTSFVSSYDYDYEHFYALKDTGEIVSEPADVKYSEDGEIIEYKGKEILGEGFKDSNSLATKDEINKLSEYAKNNDMVAFHDYQNLIFKRIIENMTLDITVTKTNGDTQTKTLEFLYEPQPFDSSQLKYYNINQSVTFSAGTLSAKIKK